MNVTTKAFSRCHTNAVFLLAIFIAIGSAEVLFAQPSMELWDTPKGWVQVSFQATDPWKRLTITVKERFGSRTLTTHTPAQIVDGQKGHFDKHDKAGKTISSPSSIIYRFKHTEGHEFKFTIDKFDDCPECLEVAGENRFDRSADPVAYNKYISVDIFVPDSQDGERKKAWVVDNRDSLVKADGGYWIDITKKTASFSLRCIQGDPINPPDTVRSLSFTANQIGAYKILADRVYTVSSTDEAVLVHGNLYHSSLLASRSGMDASFEHQPTKEPLPYFIASAGEGHHETHAYHQYEFIPVDIADGGGLFGGRITHPAGRIPAGFRAVTFKCKCCKGNPKYVVAFAGTNFWSLSDWLNNLLQATPIDHWGVSNGIYGAMPLYSLVAGKYKSPELRVAPYYTFAVEYVRWVQDEYLKSQVWRNSDDQFVSELTLVGHSLGGGLASFVSGRLGVRGFGFNSAPLVSSVQVENVKKEASRRFTQIRTKSDPVTGVFPGKLVGEVFTVESAEDYISPAHALIMDHFMGSIGTKVLSYEPAQ
jgi:hypothetical protein